MKKARSRRDKQNQFEQHFVNTQNSITKVMNSTLKRMREELEASDK